jgi:hypothetical protein
MPAAPPRTRLVMTFPSSDLPSQIVYEMTIEPAPVVWARSERATTPDETWSYTDPAGHLHCHDPGPTGPWPTLTRLRAHVRCDGTCGDPGCDGWTHPLWCCTTCRAWVTPRYVPDWHARNVGDPVQTGPATATVITIGEPIPGDFGVTHPVAVERDGHRVTGQAMLAGVTRCGRSGDARYDTRAEWSIVLDDPEG